jgi:hypothetical protein
MTKFKIVFTALATVWLASPAVADCVIGVKYPTEATPLSWVRDVSGKVSQMPCSEAHVWAHRLNAGAHAPRASVAEAVVYKHK